MTLEIKGLSAQILDVQKLIGDARAGTGALADSLRAHNKATAELREHVDKVTSDLTFAATQLGNAYSNQTEASKEDSSTTTFPGSTTASTNG